MKHLNLAAICAVLVLGGVACSKDATPAGDDTSSEEPITAENVVSVVDSAFEPNALSVAVGTTVTWDWSDTTLPHNVVSSDGTIDSGESTADPDTEFTYTFETAGTFDYMCEVHGTAMAGTITVA